MLASIILSKLRKKDKTMLLARATYYTQPIRFSNSPTALLSPAPSLNKRCRIKAGTGILLEIVKPPDATFHLGGAGVVQPLVQISQLKRRIAEQASRSYGGITQAVRICIDASNWTNQAQNKLNRATKPTSQIPARSSFSKWPHKPPWRKVCCYIPIVLTAILCQSYLLSSSHTSQSSLLQTQPNCPTSTHIFPQWPLFSQI